MTLSLWKEILTAFAAALLFLFLYGVVWAQKIHPKLESELRALPPEGKISVIVVLGDRADLNAVLQRAGRGKGARRKAVIEALKKKAIDTQPYLLTLLARWQAEGQVGRFAHLWITNGLEVTGTESVVRDLAALPEILTIEPNLVISVPPLAPAAAETPTATSEWNIAKIRAPEVWALGFQGHGTVVGGIDTGVLLTHPDLQGRWRGGSNSWLDVINRQPTPYDDNGHGTHTIGTVAGGSAGGTNIGVAPGAKWIACKFLNSNGSGSFFGAFLCMQWMLDPDGNPATDDAPDVVNNSWGTIPGCFSSLDGAVASWRAAGIFPVFAAGNSGPGAATGGTPAVYPESFAVGATNINDTIASFSSRGPSSCDGTIFPEVSAPGVSVKSALNNGGYAFFSGTSMAAPHVAGAVALLRNVDPGLSVGQIENLLKSKAVDLGESGPDNAYGFGRIDVFAAVSTIAPVISVSPTGPTDFGTVAVGSAVSRTFTVENRGGGTLTGSATTALPFSVVSGGNYSLMSSQSAQVVVRFSPASAGTFSKSVTFTGGGGASTTVTGIGLAALCSTSSISSGETKTGVLDNTDCDAPHRPGRFADLYTFSGTAGQQVRIRMNSSFDTFLFLEGPLGTIIAFNDDCPGVGLNSCIPSNALSGGTLSLPRNGTYTIEATSFGFGATGIYTVSLSLVSPENRPPVANAGGPYAVNEGGTVTLTGTGSDPDGNSLTFAWDLDNNGTFETPGASVTFSAAGIDGPSARTVTLRVTDTGGLSATSTATINIINVPPTLVSVVNSGPVNEGSPVTVTASATDPGQDTLTYLFDLNNDGIFEVSQASPAVTHTYPDNGSFPVRVQVRDDDGALSAVLTTTIVVNNVSPTITAITAMPNPANEGQAVTFTSAFTDPGTNDTHIVQWNFGDGTPPVSGTLTPTHPFVNNGTFTVTLTVTDDDNGTTSRELIVTVNNVPPTIASVTNSGPVNEGSPVTVTAVATDPGVNDTLTYYFDFNNDGVFEIVQSSSSATFTYPDNGSFAFAVQVQVRDQDGGVSAIATTTVIVNNVTPTLLSVVNNGPVNEGSPVSVTASATDPGADILTYYFDFNNDGIFEVIQSSPVATYTFSDNGSYPVRVQVRDDDGGQSNILTTTVVINNVAPIVFARSNLTTNEGSVIDLSGTTFSDSGFGDSHTATVNWSDGNAGAAVVTVTNPGGPGTPRQGTVAASHVYADNGVYTVQVCVTDDDKGQGCGSFTATVNNVPPTITVSGSTSVYEGQSMTLAVTANDLGTADVVTLTASGLPLGAGLSQSSGNPAMGTLTWTPAYTQAGSYPGVTLTAADDDDASTTQTLTLVVNEKGQPVIVVTNSNDRTVSLINAQTNHVVGTEAVGKRPVAASFFDVFFAPSVPPAKLYVAERDTDKDINKADDENDAPDKGKGAVHVLVGSAGPSFANPYDFSFGTAVQVENRPEGLAIRPGGSEIWTANRNDDSISIIDRVTEEVIATVPLKVTESSSGKGKAKETEIGRKPMALAFSPDGQFAYVVGRNSNNLIVVNAATRAILSSVEVGNKPVALVVSPDGTRLYVANRSGGDVTIVDLTNPSSPAFLRKVPMGGKPEALALLPNDTKLGRKLYVTDSETNSVVVFDVLPTSPYLSLRKTVEVGLSPSGVAVTKPGSFINGEYVYVANRDDGTVSVIDAVTDTIVPVIDAVNNAVVLAIPVGKGPKGVAAGIIPTAP